MKQLYPGSRSAWTIMPRIQVISIYGAAGKRTQTTHTFPAALREAVMVMGI